MKRLGILLALVMILLTVMALPVAAHSLRLEILGPPVMQMASAPIIGQESTQLQMDGLAGNTTPNNFYALFYGAMLLTIIGVIWRRKRFEWILDKVSGGLHTVIAKARVEFPLKFPILAC